MLLSYGVARSASYPFLDILLLSGEDGVTIAP
jgi:hypothetical protein